MKILSIAMALSALALFSVPSSAEYKFENNVQTFQKEMSMSRVEQPKVMQLSFNNKERKISEKAIYEKVMRGAKEDGFELKEVEAMKIAHIVNGALDNEPPQAASISIKVTIHLKRPVKIEIELSL
jgi:regulatory protein YycH of two-component signal transduction system YycFG